MREFDDRHQFTRAQKERYLVEHLDPAIEQCLRHGQYFLGREADFILPDRSAIEACARGKGSARVAGYFGINEPDSHHLLLVMRECWDDIVRRFQLLNVHTVPTGEAVKMTRGAPIVLTRLPNGNYVGWGEVIPRDRANDIPARLRVRRGAATLGILTEEVTKTRSDVGQPRRFIGELREPWRRNAVLHSADDGPVEIRTRPGHAHLAALERGELGVDLERLTRIDDGLFRKMTAERAVMLALKDLESVIPDGEFKTLATACRLIGADWRQTTFEYVDDAFRLSAAAD